MTPLRTILPGVGNGAARLGRTALPAVALALLQAGCVTVPAKDTPGDTRDTPVVAQFENMPVAEIVAAGDEAWRAGEPERAVFIYMQALAVADDAAVWLKVGKLQRHSGETVAAWQAFERVIALEPDNAEAHELLGMLYIGSKQKESAIRHLEKAVELDRSRWMASNALGVLADTARDYERAIGHYETALEQHPDSAMLLTNLGYSNYLAGRLDEAERLFRVAIGIDRHYRPAAANLGLVRARRREYDSAVRVLANVMDRAQALNDVGYIAFVNGDLDDAERLLGDAIKASPSYYETAYVNLDRVRSAREGDRPRAEEIGTADGAAGGPVVYRTVSTYRLDVREADSVDAPIVGFIAADNRVRVLVDEGNWSFVTYEDDGAGEALTGWVLSGLLSDPREESE